MGKPSNIAGMGIKCAPFDNSGHFTCKAGANGEARDAVHEWVHDTSGAHGFFCPSHSPFDYKPGRYTSADAQAFALAEGHDRETAMDFAEFVAAVQVAYADDTLETHWRHFAIARRDEALDL